MAIPGFNKFKFFKYEKCIKHMFFFSFYVYVCIIVFFIFFIIIFYFYFYLEFKATNKFEKRTDDVALYFILILFI